jgi:hypothetical protein
VNTLVESLFGPDWDRFQQENRILLESAPFLRSQDGKHLRKNHIWDVHRSGIQHECLSRVMLESAILEAVKEYKQGQADSEQEQQGMFDRTKEALNWIDAILVCFYPRQKKLDRKLQDIAKAVQSVSLADYAKIGDFKRRREKWLKDRLMRSLFIAFQQFGPLHYSPEQFFFAVAEIVKSFKIEEIKEDETSGLIVDRLKKRWYALQHPRDRKIS